MTAAHIDVELRIERREEQKRLLASHEQHRIEVRPALEVLQHARRSPGAALVR